MSTSDLSSASGTFGPNLWLVEEMYQLFRDDPSSVDPSWHEFFADYQPADAGVAGGVTDGRTDPPVAAPPRHQQQVEKVAAADPAGAKRASFTRTRPSEKPVAGSASKATSSGVAATTGTVSPLRGAASMVVKNMQASLEVPTATSVRAVPAKLLVDNRR